MFKGTSANQQSRERRRVTEDRTNTGGVDPSTFKGPAEYHSVRRELALAKKDAEQKVSMLNAQIAVARRRYTHNERGQVDRRTLDRWDAERCNLAAKITGLDRRLTEMKIYGFQHMEADTKSFSEAFKVMAKELLAPDVYNRIITATIHRIGEAEPEAEEK